MLNARTIKEAQARLEQVQRRARCRTLEAGDITEAVRLYRKARKIARSLGVNPDSARVYMDGGAVGNSYGYAAESTQLHVDAAGIHVSRGYSRHGAGGDCGRTTSSCACPDGKTAKQAWGRRSGSASKYMGRLSW